MRKGFPGYLLREKWRHLERFEVTTLTEHVMQNCFKVVDTFEHHAWVLERCFRCYAKDLYPLYLISFCIYKIKGFWHNDNKKTNSWK